MGRLPYSSISVKHLCEQANLSRKVFYRYYNGKLDVLTSIFRRDVLQPTLDLCELLSFEKIWPRAASTEQHMFQAVYDDREFYGNVARAPQGGEEAFLKAAGLVFAEWCRFVLQKQRYPERSWQTAYIVSFFSHAKAHYLLDWLLDDCTPSVEEAAGLFSDMALPFWRALD